MRHNLKGRKLNRTSSHRKALFANMAQALIIHGQIKTTLPKAKELRPYVEKLVTMARKDTLASFRNVISRVRNVDVARQLTKEIAPRFKNTQGGYLRIIKAGSRYGDNAPMAYIQFTDHQVEGAEVSAAPNVDSKVEITTAKKTKKSDTPKKETSKKED